MTMTRIHVAGERTHTPTVARILTVMDAEWKTRTAGGGRTMTQGEIKEGGGVHQGVLSQGDVVHL